MQSEWKVYELVAYWKWEIGRENYLCVLLLLLYVLPNECMCMCLCVYGKFTAAYRLAIYKIFTRKMLLNNSCMNCRRGWTELKRIWKRSSNSSIAAERKKYIERCVCDVFKVHVLKHVRLHYARVLFLLYYYIFFIWTAYKRWKDVQIIEYAAEQKEIFDWSGWFSISRGYILFSLLLLFLCSPAQLGSAQVENGSAWITG